MEAVPPQQSKSSSDLPQHVVEHMDKLSKAEKEFLDLIKETDIAKDGRWASIAITKVEEATMSARRAFAMANKQ
jgi:hypothetical protein